MAKPNLINIIDSKADKDYIHEAIEAKFNNFTYESNVYSKDEIESLLNLKSDKEHTHSNYYDIDKTEELLNTKADLVHSHDDLYITKEELDNFDKSDLGGIGIDEDLNGIEVIYRGGTSEEHENFIGAEKEITVDTTNWSLRVHDGITPGGHKINSSQNNNSLFLNSPNGSTWRITVSDAGSLEISKQ